MKNYKLIAVITSIVILCVYPSSKTLAQQAGKNQDICTCPSYHKLTKETLRNFLNFEVYQKKREQLGLSGLKLHEIKLLTDETDTKACQQIKEKYDTHIDNHFTNFYKSGSLYFIVYALDTIPKYKNGNVILSTGISVIKLLDKNFEQVGRVSM